MVIAGIVIVLLILASAGKRKSQGSEPNYEVLVDFSEPIEDVKWVGSIVWWVIKVAIFGIMVAGLATAN